MSEHIETYVHWCDDGVTIMCERQECWQPAPPPMEGMVFFQEVIQDYWLTVEKIQKAMDTHLATHTD